MRSAGADSCQPLALAKVAVNAQFQRTLDHLTLVVLNLVMSLVHVHCQVLEVTGQSACWWTTSDVQVSTGFHSMYRGCLDQTKLRNFGAIVCGNAFDTRQLSDVVMKTVVLTTRSCHPDLPGLDLQLDVIRNGDVLRGLHQLHGA